MKILVTGVNGQLGYDVVKKLSKRGHHAIGVGREQMDLISTQQIIDCIMGIKPEGIIHCAAYTAVDKAEEEKELCTRINAEATKDIAQCAKELDIPMIYISTDYIFDGSELTKEYSEDDNPNPINIYGATKYKGELYVKELLNKYYIVRISWVFGENGNNFIDTMMRLSKDRDILKIVSDQVGSPTYTKDIAPILVDMIEQDKYGTYHVTNEGFCSWYEFAEEIFQISEVDIEVLPINTSEYPTKATRPLNSKMSKQKLAENGFDLPRHWKEAVKEYVLLQKR